MPTPATGPHLSFLFRNYQAPGRSAVFMSTNWAGSPDHRLTEADEGLVDWKAVCRQLVEVTEVEAGPVPMVSPVVGSGWVQASGSHNLHCESGRLLREGAQVGLLLQGVRAYLREGSLTDIELTVDRVIGPEPVFQHFFQPGVGRRVANRCRLELDRFRFTANVQLEGQGVRVTTGGMWIVEHVDLRCFEIRVD